MLVNEIRDNIYEKLAPYASKDLRFGKTPLHHFAKNELITLDQILDNPPEIVPGIERPECPVTSSHGGGGGLGLHKYKEEVGAYIAQWGIIIKSPVTVSSLLLEVLANFCDSTLD